MVSSGFHCHRLLWTNPQTWAQLTRIWELIWSSSSFNHVHITVCFRFLKKKPPLTFLARPVLGDAPELQTKASQATAEEERYKWNMMLLTCHTDNNNLWNLECREVASSTCSFYTSLPRYFYLLWWSEHVNKSTLLLNISHKTKRDQSQQTLDGYSSKSKVLLKQKILWNVEN